MPPPPRKLAPGTGIVQGAARVSWRVRGTSLEVGRQWSGWVLPGRPVSCGVATTAGKKKVPARPQPPASCRSPSRREAPVGLDGCEIQPRQPWGFNLISLCGQLAVQESEPPLPRWMLCPEQVGHLPRTDVRQQWKEWKRPVEKGIDHDFRRKPNGNPSWARTPQSLFGSEDDGNCVGKQFPNGRGQSSQGGWVFLDETEELPVEGDLIGDRWVQKQIHRGFRSR